jgi:hypothetical protein
VSRGQRGGSPTAVNLSFIDRGVLPLNPNSNALLDPFSYTVKSL